MQKEVSDSVTMCSLDLAWQSALRQRLKRRLNRFFRAKTWERTSVPHPNIRRTSECTYMTRYWGDSSSNKTLLPVVPPLTKSSLCVSAVITRPQILKAKGWLFLQKKTCSPYLRLCPVNAPQLCSADSAGRDPARTHRQQSLQEISNLIQEMRGHLKNVATVSPDALLLLS